MRFLAFQDTDRVSIGVVVGDRVAPLTGVADFYADVDGWLAKMREIQAGDLAVADLTRRPPVPATSRVLCVGLNYQAHAAEASMTVPEHPTVFGRYPSTLVSDGDAIPVPAGEDGLDWEVELAAVIGKRLRAADKATALAGVLGYTVFNDVSGRNRQFDTTQWTLGKNLDRSGPIGPVVVTADELGDPAGLTLATRVNGEVMQSGNTSDMMFSVGAILSYISQTMTLLPGDVIATGTPHGIGFTREPPVLLRPGDVVEVEIERIGRLRSPVVDAAALT